MSSWIEAIDPDSNNKYWYNSLTGESTWSDPNDINNDNNNVIETSSSVESASAVSAASYWIEAVDPTTNNIYGYITINSNNIYLNLNKETLTDLLPGKYFYSLKIIDTSTETLLRGKFEVDGF